MISVCWMQGPQHASQQAQRAGNGDPARGLDNLLYSADADFSCFADLALTSPVVSSVLRTWPLTASGEHSAGLRLYQHVGLAPGRCCPGCCARQTSSLHST